MCSCWWDILFSILWNIVCGTYGEKNRNTGDKKNISWHKREITKDDETHKDQKDKVL